MDGWHSCVQVCRNLVKVDTVTPKSIGTRDERSNPKDMLDLWYAALPHPSTYRRRSQIV